MLYLDARYRVGLQESLVSQFRLSPDVALLSARGRAETQLIGDLQRIKVYADKGFQVPQHIPENVWAAYHQLVQLGYTDHLIRE